MVGANIVSIITESLYDKPIVVFREYIQNSVDAFSNVSTECNSSTLGARIWLHGRDLYFLDNGTGIKHEEFASKMLDIANSNKIKTLNIGYKGIGRLSGLSYCKKLCFINILDYKNSSFQSFTIDGEKYNQIKKSKDFNSMSFTNLMSKIGSFDYDNSMNSIDNKKIGNLFSERNSGFLVVLKGIKDVLYSTIKDKKFIDSLGWLLPVPFSDEFNNHELHELFESLSYEPAFESSVIPAKAFDIYYENEKIIRPIRTDMLRKYTCKCNLEKYAVCMHTFSNNKIVIDNKNSFSGIRVYIDNMLLCDENELVPALQQYGLTDHSLYELIQTTKGIGAMIYIVDKLNISPNARRTFIDVTDNDALDFLNLIGEFVNNVYMARYALSNYNSIKRKNETTEEKLIASKKKALEALEILAQDKITMPEDSPQDVSFDSLNATEKKRIIKSKISKEINSLIKRYLTQTEVFYPDTCFDDFKTWLDANYHKTSNL